MRPRRCFSPLESSPGTRPRYAINARGDGNRRKSCSSARISIAVRVSIPRKHRNHAHRRAIRLRLGDLGEPRIERDQARRQMIDRQQIIVDHHALGCVRPCQTLDPPPMRTRPVASAEVQASAQQPLAQAMARPLQIFPCIITRAAQVTDGFISWCRRLHFRQQSGAQ